MVHPEYLWEELTSPSLNLSSPAEPEIRHNLFSSISRRCLPRFFLQQRPAHCLLRPRMITAISSPPLIGRSHQTASTQHWRPLFPCPRWPQVVLTTSRQHLRRVAIAYKRSHRLRSRLLPLRPIPQGKIRCRQSSTLILHQGKMRGVLRRKRAVLWR